MTAVRHRFEAPFEREPCPCCGHEVTARDERAHADGRVFACQGCEAALLLIDTPEKRNKAVRALRDYGFLMLTLRDLGWQDHHIYGVLVVGLITLFVRAIPLAVALPVALCSALVTGLYVWRHDAPDPREEALLSGEQRLFPVTDDGRGELVFYRRARAMTWVGQARALAQRPRVAPRALEQEAAREELMGGLTLASGEGSAGALSVSEGERGGLSEAGERAQSDEERADALLAAWRAE